MPLSFSQSPQPLNIFVFSFSLYITPNHPIAILHLSFLNSEQYPLKLNMSKLEIMKKIKRLSPPEPSPSIFAIYLASVCIILCFFYFDYRALTPVFRSSTWFGYNGSLGGGRRPGFFEVGTDGCDLFDGNWVWDDSYPLYRSQDCLFVDSGFRCLENGRPDDLYTKWRWQPKNCDLPRFDAKNMLEKLRNRRLVFVGDSIGRNQWESLLCMLSSAVPNKTSIYEVNGNPITKHTGFLVFKFSDYNCTIEYYRSPFLVPSGHAPAGAPEIVKTTLKVDRVDWSASRWKDADVLILNSGHWWNYEKTTRAGCYFQEGSVVKMEMSVDSAFRRSIETLIDWIGREVNLSKTQILFRSFAPVHFRDGEWNTGGSCHEETLPELGSSPVPHQSSHLEIIVDVLSKYSEKPQRNKLDLLNVTFMSSLRKDGHLSLYYQSLSQGPVALHRQDCSHWCLPGVPDSWNELLYAVFLQREFTRSQIYAQAPL